MTGYVDYHPRMCYSNPEGIPTLPGHEEAWNMSTSTYMHGRQHMPPYHPLPTPVYYDFYSKELTPSHYYPLVHPQYTLPVAPTPGAFHTSSTPSPTPSPIYPGAGIIATKTEIMEYGNESPYTTAPHAIYAPPIPTIPNTSEKTRCQWTDCPIELDDLSHSGIRRHFREYHNMERGSMVRCEWGIACRSEAMLYDNIAKHIAECHLKSMRTACKWCEKTFARNDTLKRHVNAGCPALRRQG